MSAPSYAVMSADKPLFLAGSRQQADYYARALGFKPNEWAYLSPHAGCGHINPTIYLVGTYRERPDLRTVMLALAPTRPTFLDEYGHPINPHMEGL